MISYFAVSADAALDLSWNLKGRLAATVENKTPNARGQRQQRELGTGYSRDIEFAHASMSAIASLTVSGPALWDWYQRAQHQVQVLVSDPTFAAQLVRELDWLLLAVSDLDPPRTSVT